MRIRQYGLILFAIAAVFVFSSSALAAESAKVGFFSNMEVTQSSVWGKKIVEQLQAEDRKLSADLEEKSKPMKTAKDDYDKKKDGLDEKAKGRKIKELQDMDEAFRKSVMEAKQKFEKLEQELRAPYTQKLKEAIQKVAKDGKYDFVLDKSVLGYANESYDLTKKIIAEMDKAAPR